MSLLLNIVYLVAALVWLGMVLNQTLTTTLTPDIHPDWPMRQFWVSERLRRICLFLLFLSAVGWVIVIMGGAVPTDRSGTIPALLVAGALLAGVGAAALLYSILLYRRPSVGKPDGF